MKIKVYNNNKKVFEGKAKDFLIINEFDEETKRQLKSVFITNYCRSYLLGSGLWVIEKII